MLDIIEGSSITNFTSDSLFRKAALDWSFEPSRFIPGLIPIPERIIVPPIFTADFPVGQSERTLDFSGLYTFKTILIIYKEIYGLV